jgi:hypothetical protein
MERDRIIDTLRQTINHTFDAVQTGAHRPGEVDRLALDLQRTFPIQQGFSPRNLKYMRAFAEAWPETIIVQPAVAQLPEARKSKRAIVQAPLAQL